MHYYYLCTCKTKLDALEGQEGVIFCMLSSMNGKSFWREREYVHPHPFIKYLTEVITCLVVM